MSFTSPHNKPNAHESSVKMIRWKPDQSDCWRHPNSGVVSQVVLRETTTLLEVPPPLLFCNPYMAKNNINGFDHITWLFLARMYQPLAAHKLLNQFFFDSRHLVVVQQEAAYSTLTGYGDVWNSNHEGPIIRGKTYWVSLVDAGCETSKELN